MDVSYCASFGATCWIVVGLAFGLLLYGTVWLTS